MIRRRVLFVKNNGVRYITPEFNGDRAELERISSRDSCDKTWEEMMRDIWMGVTDYISFVKANATAQSQYHSCVLGREVLTVKCVPKNRCLPADCDEIVVLYEGSFPKKLSDVITVYHPSSFTKSFEAKTETIGAYLEGSAG